MQWPLVTRRVSALCLLDTACRILGGGWLVDGCGRSNGRKWFHLFSENHRAVAIVGNNADLPRLPLSSNQRVPRHLADKSEMTTNGHPNASTK